VRLPLKSLLSLAKDLDQYNENLIKWNSQTKKCVLYLVVQMFGLGTLLEACLLFVNAVAVLHEERFLKKYGLLWDHYYDDFLYI